MNSSKGIIAQHYFSIFSLEKFSYFTNLFTNFLLTRFMYVKLQQSLQHSALSSVTCISLNCWDRFFRKLLSGENFLSLWFRCLKTSKRQEGKKYFIHKKWLQNDITTCRENRKKFVRNRNMCNNRLKKHLTNYAWIMTTSKT